MAHAPTAPGPAAPVELRVAILGAGTVGSEVLRLLTEQSGDLASRVGAHLTVTGISVRDTTRDRGPHVDPMLYTEDPSALVRDADLVVEVMGGIEPARTLLLEAMEHGASVVTANKALLAQEGPALHEAADRAGVDLNYEAAVAGAIPLVRPIRESLAGDRISSVHGIVNGTTNYILDAMTRTGADFADALASAQELGYAEADPTADVEGLDAAAKASILASLAFHTRVSLDDVHCEGITSISSADIAAAERLGRVIKLLSIVERVDGPEGERVSARVHPVMIPRSHPLASVAEAYNAVFVEADAAGGLLFYGQGAGGAPTASAVLGDLVAVARQRVQGGRGPRESRYASLPVASMSDLTSAFYLGLSVQDAPGVLAQVAGVLSGRAISIATIHQELLDGDDAEGARARIGIVTHDAREVDLAAALEDLRALEAVDAIDSVIRVEGE